MTRTRMAADHPFQYVACTYVTVLLVVRRTQMLRSAGYNPDSLVAYVIKKKEICSGTYLRNSTGRTFWWRTFDKSPWFFKICQKYGLLSKDICKSPRTFACTFVKSPSTQKYTDFWQKYAYFCCFGGHSSKSRHASSCCKSRLSTSVLLRRTYY